MWSGDMSGFGCLAHCVYTCFHTRRVFFAMGLTPHRLFSLDGQVAIVTGGTGILGSAMAAGLAEAGARVAVLGRNGERGRRVADAIRASGGDAIAVTADVVQRDQVEAARVTVLDRWGRIDILVNAAGGNVASAIATPEQPFFGLSTDALRQVVDLNLLGTIVPSQVFGESMAHAGSGCIVNISSMASQRALTRIGAYGAAKAGVESFTRWLAIELARGYGEGIRVNAIAPGFFLAEQNRALLTNLDGSLTARGETITAHTPAGRFGNPEDLVGTLIWLCSPGAIFVNGVVVPVDGGFSAFSGV